MMFDADIVIWAIRGRAWALGLPASAENPTISSARWM
jgi:hypothetical protein